MEHCQRHVTHAALFALDHFHVDGKGSGKLPWLHRFILFLTIEEHLKRRDHSVAAP